MNKILVWEIADRQGRLTPVVFDQAPESINHASRMLPGGVYTSFRTYHGSKILSLEEHFLRLETSAALLGKPIRVDRELVRLGLRSALGQRGELDDGPAHTSFDRDVRLRLTLDLEETSGKMYISMDRLVVPSHLDYKQGVLAVTCREHRDNPEAKQTAFINVAEMIRQELPPGVHEGLLVNGQGRILEGLSSNFFGVVSSELWTADDAVLSGITRQELLEIAQADGIAIQMRAVTLDTLTEIEEAFITSSTRGVLPIRQIDQTVIGRGAPGPLTIRLARLFQAQLESRLEPV
jgi:branched-chain amino acid aminotransferase